MTIRNPSFDKTVEVPVSICTECGAKPDRVSGRGMPKKDDVTLCIKCGALHIFKEDLTLRPLTEEEQREISKDPQVMRVRMAILAGNAHLAGRYVEPSTKAKQ